MKNIENLLSIIIATYNRSELFENTLKQLSSSCVSKCRITVLNNCSTDNTLEIFQKWKSTFPNICIVTHPVNLGGGCENYIHAIEYCDTPYMWILADDDNYDFSNFEDVIDAMSEEKAVLIHVGAHDEGKWDWGIYTTPRKLTDEGYNYFKYSSFLPCNIFKFSYFTQYMKDAYYYLHFRYPHMPSLIAAYKNDNNIYVSKKRIVTATVGNQRYGGFVTVQGNVVLSKLLDSKEDKRKILFPQRNENKTYYLLRYTYYYFFPINFEKTVAFLTLFKYMEWYNKIIYFIAFFPIVFAGYFVGQKKGRK